MTASKKRVFLFLQGPNCQYFHLLGKGLASRGHDVYRINFCLGDWFFWRNTGVLNFRGKIDDWPNYIENVIHRYSITDILLISEHRTYHKIAIRIAQQHDVNVVVTDYGYIRPDWVTLERNGMSGDSNFPKTPETITRLAGDYTEIKLDTIYDNSFWVMAFYEVTYHLITSLGLIFYPHFKWHHIHHPTLSHIATGIRFLLLKYNKRHALKLIDDLSSRTTRFYLFPLQMQNDFAVREYYEHSDQHFAIAETIESFSNHSPENSALIFKIHPWDPGLDNWHSKITKLSKKFNVSDRVFYIDGGDLDDISQEAAGVITINSTSGLQVLLKDCPVKTLGKAIYDIPGLTFQGDLNEFWSSAMPPDKELLSNFLKAMVNTLQVRGVYYKQPGLDNAVIESIAKLESNNFI
jgi:capsular polysaccharide export protein